jgi:hypothetical protein
MGSFDKSTWKSFTCYLPHWLTSWNTSSVFFLFLLLCLCSVCTRMSALSIYICVYVCLQTSFQCVFVCFSYCDYLYVYPVYLFVLLSSSLVCLFFFFLFLFLVRLSFLALCVPVFFIAGLCLFFLPISLYCLFCCVSSFSFSFLYVCPF